ncbi:MAG TPA: bifunctional phosphoglucose/phosphomannose isomerase [Dehalococcoidia bacterium]|nr:bifunctional phosphoglucose/phosphomannose isomerase [Dehalococcoidia bacterium]
MGIADAALLDDAERMRRQDPGDMLGRIRELPEQVVAAWRDSRGAPIGDEYREVDHIVVFAMGGSAIGADLLRTLMLSESPVPMIVVRGYDAPAFVGPRTLAVASSYSGGTEETLSAFGQALERGARAFVLTGGGELLRMAGERGLPFHIITYEAMPRAALAHSLMPLAALVSKLGFLSLDDGDVEAAARAMQARRDAVDAPAPLESNEAKRLALRLAGRVPIIIGAEHLSEVARRWRGQIAENGKAWSFTDELPELNHNTVVGLPNPQVVLESATAIFLSSPALHQRTLLRYDLTAQMLKGAGIESVRVEADGATRLGDLLSLVMLGDYVSYYLAMLYGADPTEVRVIERLKRELSEATPLP